MYTKQSLTKVFLIAIAVFVFWVGTAEAEDSLPKQINAFGWKSSPLLTTSIVDVLERRCLLGVSAVQGNHLEANLEPTGPFNPNDAEADSASGNTYFKISKDRKDSGEAFEGACCGLPVNGKFQAGVLAGVVGGVTAGIAADYIVCKECDVQFWMAVATGISLGSSIGVYIVGNIGDETGSFLATLGGSMLGEVVGFAATYTTGAPGLLVMLFGPPIGATIGFNKTRRYKSPPTSETALINLGDGQVSLVVPSIYFRPDPFDGRNLIQNVDLVRMKF
ncbi:hypothetical protein FJZ31_40840 [Candidatus Poribacteria bacterium]|nr:hypothetical protein [Candidatus Poribacteria bacterium]